MRANWMSIAMAGRSFGCRYKFMFNRVLVEVMVHNSVIRSDGLILSQVYNMKAQDTGGLISCYIDRMNRITKLDIMISTVGLTDMSDVANIIRKHNVIQKSPYLSGIAV